MPGHGAAARAAGAGGAATYQLVEIDDCPARCRRDERSLFDGIDTTIAGLAQFAGASVRRKELIDGLAAIADAVAERAEGVRDGQRRRDAAAAARRACRRARRCAASCARCDRRGGDGSRSISACARRSASSSRRSILANGVRVEALADDGVVVPGQPVKVYVIVANAAPATSTVKQVKFDGFDGDATCTLTAFTGGGFAFRAAAAEAAAARARRRRQPMSSCREGSGRALRADADDSGDRARHRAVLAPRGRGRPLHVRRRRAVRPAVSGRRRSTSR